MTYRMQAIALLSYTPGRLFVCCETVYNDIFLGKWLFVPTQKYRGASPNALVALRAVKRHGPAATCTFHNLVREGVAFCEPAGGERLDDVNDVVAPPVPARRR